MGEEQFSESFVDGLIPPLCAQSDVFQRQPLQVFIEIPFEFDAAQRRHPIDERMPGFRRKAIAVPRGAGGGITQSARSHDRRVAVISSLIRHHTDYVRHSNYV